MAKPAARISDPTSCPMPSITLQDRANVWWALSDAFVDNEVDYAAIAKQVEHLEPEEIKSILYSEVAPVCHPNLGSVIPTIWLCFNRDELENDINEMLEARKKSSLRRQRDKLLTHRLSYRYQYIWQEIAKHYQNKKRQQYE
ncbi:hypothetical protein PSCICM_24430 [Pseudomonas cichorii]|uniref:DUF7079 family protein n=1 Tax=Pseudomonas cichorii TaxID=36746 RepID=UPI0019DB4CEE|nr:hypothetical protein [Pseudomonas cichorii]GFM76624.1 hypothetical protein PSCICM_24430 [Pseudomonas cichorii]